MKKSTLFSLAYLASIVVLQAQNLLINPGFESWTSGKPDSWTVGTTGTLSQSTTTPSGSGRAVQVAATGTFSITQNVPAPTGGFNSTDKYQIVIKYKASAGDGTDSRIWCNWITSPIGAATTTYWSMSKTDSLGLKGPGGNNQPASGTAGNGINGYLIDSRTSSGFLTYTYSFYPPANATQFAFQIRTYNTATVVWDDLYFGLEGTYTSTPANTTSSFYLDNQVLKNISVGAVVKVYNLLGKQIVCTVATGNSFDLSRLSKGVYVVQINNHLKKITI